MPKTSMTFFLSDSARKAKLEALEEMQELGAKTPVVASTADARARRAASFNLEYPVAASAAPGW